MSNLDSQPVVPLLCVRHGVEFPPDEGCPACTAAPPNPGMTDCCHQSPDARHGFGICWGPRWIGRLRRES